MEMIFVDKAIIFCLSLFILGQIIRETKVDKFASWVL